MKGWWPKTSCPPSKVCLPWVSKRGIRDVPGILPGCPGPLGVFKNQGKKKHININKFAGLSWDWVGAKILFMCFFRAIPYGGEKTHKQNSPQNPGTIPGKFCLRVLFFMCFFRSLKKFVQKKFVRICGKLHDGLLTLEVP